MKKLIVLACGLSLAGCASMPAPHAVYVPPPVSPAPTVTVVPAAPVQPGTFKMRWNALHPHVHFFHHKKGS